MLFFMTILILRSPTRRNGGKAIGGGMVFFVSYSYIKEGEDESAFVLFSHFQQFDE
jgi:hypothetical protein